MANRRGDIILHVNPRINDRALVLNSAPGGNWGSEERKPLSITRGHQFSLIIMVTEQGFKIAVNNQHTADFPYRMPYNAADLVTVKGDVNLTNVHVYPGMGGQHGQPWRFAKVKNSLAFFYLDQISLFLGNSRTNECFSWYDERKNSFFLITKNV